MAVRLFSPPPNLHFCPHETYWTQAASTGRRCCTQPSVRRRFHTQAIMTFGTCVHAASDTTCVNHRLLRLDLATESFIAVYEDVGLYRLILTAGLVSEKTSFLYVSVVLNESPKSQKETPPRPRSSSLWGGVVLHYRWRWWNCQNGSWSIMQNQKLHISGNAGPAVPVNKCRMCACCNYS